ncbi:TPA: hypothetical protein RG395_002384 [Legionella pneumophila]|nr:hypothetical protein [Legionella pneumophila]MDW8878729.1 hypothetical protein [Legionella pneumophila subsp. fraseri]MDW8962957.1 hypothetical protein [Legionella pneumophila subsp. fraseri]MDW9035453.1 hypothetical protein [Legionella pneumophila subsp. fraseri]MDW9038514.1 hypothetical protein [Legionella pneumophila subsp. fraseri]MDW9041575.1 hypothetical protein [Legionella pneumophila subsp. fraseri]
MKQYNRILAYKKSIELSLEHLLEISGGSSKATVNRTQKLTNVYPSGNDFEFDQVWD